MARLKRIGPKMEPCGTAHVIGSELDFELPYFHDLGPVGDV